MQDGEFFVDILDKAGKIVGQKQRKDIIKGVDIYHAVYCVLITTDGKLAVSLIAQREDLPNLHAGSYGCTAATIRRSREAADVAMSRALDDELGIVAEPEVFFEDMIAVDDTYRKLSLYTVASEVPTDYSKRDIELISTFSKQEFEELLAVSPEKVTPILKLFWEKYTQI